MLSSPTNYLCIETEKDSESFEVMFADTSILPHISLNHDFSDEFMNNSMQMNRLDDIQDQHTYLNNYEDSYPQGSRHFIKSFLMHDSESDYKMKPLTAWNETDVKCWIIEMASRRRLNLPEIPYCNFKNVNGVDLIKMSKDNFCERMYSQSNMEGSLRIGETLYEDLQQLCVDSHNEQEVPVPVMDRFNLDENLHNTSTEDCEKNQILDLDSSYNHAPKGHIVVDNYNYGFVLNGLNCDSGYDSVSEEYDQKNSECNMISLENDSSINSMEPSRPLIIAKRPPGRPKGSGKKHPKRVKNVSVPEFLRDLLLNPKYCPRIIKWEDYANGKFRFVRADEVAKLWGGKRNNEKMSFEKFSRAMRYHYKQGVLVSVPTARLVYQFGPKAPQYVTSNPNFEPASGKFGMR